MSTSAVNKPAVGYICSVFPYNAQIHIKIAWFGVFEVSSLKMKRYPKADSGYRPAHGLQVTSAVFLPSTGALVVSGRDGTLRVFRISSRRLPPAPVPHGTTATKATQVSRSAGLVAPR